MGHDKITNVTEILLNALNFASPEWVPPANTAAAQNAGTPSDVGGGAFFDPTATYRGAFEPGGSDWSAAWTAYP